MGHFLFWFVCKRLGKDAEVRSAKKQFVFLISSLGVWFLHFAAFSLYARLGIAIVLSSVLLFVTAPLVVQLVVRKQSASKSKISPTSVS